MGEELRAAHAHCDGVVEELGIVAATIRSHGQISISPPAITLPCTSARVGLGMLRQRSQKPT